MFVNFVYLGVVIFVGEGGWYLGNLLFNRFFWWKLLFSSFEMLVGFLLFKLLVVIIVNGFVFFVGWNGFFGCWKKVVRRIVL